ncbi:hypothetical protein ACH4SP_04160 [Streptomyces sp. NPDC021093]|uniref:hypothetical protein n=1 Tax=Streptomyces sp. NPDC021093 TaxID=3365112 RepID=UPI0037A233D0
MTSEGHEHIREHMYEITYLCADPVPAPRRVTASEVAGIVARAGLTGARVLVRPCAHPVIPQDGGPKRKETSAP